MSDAPDATVTVLRGSAARRQRVIAAAMELAASGGYDAVQLREVSARANVALGTIYRYFTSKDALLSAVSIEWTNELQRRVQRRPLQATSATERVVELLRRATNGMERQPRLSAALVRAMSSVDSTSSGVQVEAASVIQVLVEQAVADTGVELRPGVARTIGFVWFAALVGWVAEWPTVPSPGDEVEAAVRLLIPE